MPYPKINGKTQRRNGLETWSTHVKKRTDWKIKGIRVSRAFGFEAIGDMKMFFKLHEV